MSIRRATPADLDVLMSMERTIFPDDAWTTEQMAQGLNSPYAHYIVVEHDGNIIGYAGAFHLPGDDDGDYSDAAGHRDTPGDARRRWPLAVAVVVEQQQ